jgi:hypothetical protein
MNVLLQLPGPNGEPCVATGPQNQFGYGDGKKNPALTENQTLDVHFIASQFTYGFTKI